MLAIGKVSQHVTELLVHPEQHRSNLFPLFLQKQSMSSVLFDHNVLERLIVVAGDSVGLLELRAAHVYSGSPHSLQFLFLACLYLLGRLFDGEK